MSRIIVFVDGYRYIDKDLIKLDGINLQFRKMVPSFGYSVNLHHELFSEKTPSDLGFFGDMRKNEVLDFDDGMVAKVVDYFRLNFPFLARILYKVYMRLARKYIAFIPASLVNSFTPVGEYLLQISDTLDIGGVSYRVLNYDRQKFGNRDKNAYKDALSAIKNGELNQLISFTELDWISHKFGVGSSEHNEKINTIVHYINNIYKAAKEVDSDVELVIVSDHGMVNSDHAVNYNLEKKFGRSGSNGAVFFYDSLYMSMWDEGNDSLYLEIKEYLMKQDEGEFISKEDRVKYNLSDEIFGKDIYILKPGYAFAPNYFGYSLLKAYHGYHPESCKENVGIFCTTSAHIIETEEFRTVDVYNYLNK